MIPQPFNIKDANYETEAPMVKLFRTAYSEGPLPDVNTHRICGFRLGRLILRTPESVSDGIFGEEVFHIFS